MKQTKFKFGELIVALEHPGVPLGEKIEKDYAPWAFDGRATPHAKFRITPNTAPPRPDAGAVRIRYWEEFKSFAYAIPPHLKFELFEENYFVRKDFKTNETSVVYQTDTPGVLQLGGSAFKWTVIKALEQQGYGYIHGAGVLWRDRLLVFSGNPGAGKSSCATRLQLDGAELISDDTVLFRGQTLQPFDHKASIRGDFGERFDASLPKAPSQIQPLTHSLSALVFPVVWEHPRSGWERISHEEGMTRLERTYWTETDWNTFPESLSEVRDVYEKFCHSAPFFEFRQGFDESHARETLLKHCLALASVPSSSRIAV